MDLPLTFEIIVSGCSLVFCMVLAGWLAGWLSSACGGVVGAPVSRMFGLMRVFVAWQGQGVGLGPHLGIGQGVGEWSAPRSAVSVWPGPGRGAGAASTPLLRGRGAGFCALEWVRAKGSGNFLEVSEKCFSARLFLFSELFRDNFFGGPFLRMSLAFCYSEGSFKSFSKLFKAKKTTPKTVFRA